MSGSLTNRVAACRMAAAYARSSAARSPLPSGAYRVATASMSARSRGLTRDAPASARCAASNARRPFSGVIGALRLGPYATASPQYAIAIWGSSRAASRNARIASAWLNAYRSRIPWSKNRCAAATDVVTGMCSAPIPESSGARGAGVCALTSGPPANRLNTMRAAVSADRMSLAMSRLRIIFIFLRRCRLRPADFELVVHGEYAADLARSDLGDLPVRGVVHHAEQGRSPVLHDDVDRVNLERLHTREASHLRGLAPRAEGAARRVSGQEVVGVDAVERGPPDPVVVRRRGEHFELVGDVHLACRAPDRRLGSRVEMTVVGVAGQRHFSAIDADRHEIEDPVVSEAFKRPPNRLCHLPCRRRQRAAGRRPRENPAQQQAHEDARCAWWSKDFRHDFSPPAHRNSEPRARGGRGAGWSVCVAESDIWKKNRGRGRGSVPARAC